MLSPGIVLQQRYRIKRLLARGGMGAVYEAEDGRLRNATVAVKETFFDEDRQSLREQFEREAATLARLRHPALPHVKDHFIEGGGQFLVMDFIAGDDLGNLLDKRKGKPFGFWQVVEWAERLLDALDYIHGQYPPVIHRDIKPQNLKLTPRGELFLIDFGLAKDATTPTRPGHSIHAYTLEFAPPEQIKGSGTDARSDLYSLGATLYHLVTGKFPPDARIREEAVVKHLMPDPLQPAHQVNPQVPFAFAAALSKAMAFDREQRYQSAQEMWQALRRMKQDIEAESAERERQEAERRRLEEEERKSREEETRQREVEERRRREEAARRQALREEVTRKKEELVELERALQQEAATERTEQQRQAGSEQRSDPASQRKGSVKFQPGHLSEPLKKSLLFITLIIGMVSGALLYKYTPLKEILDNPTGNIAPNERGQNRFKDHEISSAFALHQEGRSDEARTRINAALNADPANAEALYYLGRIDLDQKKYDDAVNHLREATRLDAKLPDVWAFLATAYLGLGHSRNAMEALLRVSAPALSTPSPTPAG